MKKSTAKISSILLSLALVLSLTACGTAPAASSAASPPPAAASIQPEKPTAEPETGITLTDQAGREVVLKKPAERIVSGYYISSSACIALGLTDKLAGIEAKAANRPIYKMAAPALLELPNVGTAKEFNMEGCIALNPDLVILPTRLKDNAETMTALGIPVLLVNPESHQELADMILLIGKATGTQERAEKLIAYYNAELAAVAGLIKGAKEQPVTYMGGNSNYLSTAPKDMYQASLITAAGGINAAQEVDGDNWVDISYEQLIAMNPDVIVIPAEAGYGKADILNDVHLANVTAVKEGKIYEMPKGFEAWDSPVPSATLGIRWLLCVLHEDIYPLETLQADAASFYSEFYGVKLDPGMISK